MCVEVANTLKVECIDVNNTYGFINCQNMHKTKKWNKV